MIASPPRFFRETRTGMTWEWRNGRMTLDCKVAYAEPLESIFTCPDELLECLDVIETDENGEPLSLTPAEADEIRGEKLQQAEADES